jgi:hypothetical protein
MSDAFVGILLIIPSAQHSFSFSRHWAPSQHVHIGHPYDGILKYGNM